MPNPILEKSYTLSVLVVKLCTGPQADKLDLLRNQLFRSGTGCGANVEESQAAESPRDFVHKIGIATKEAHETGYWLRLAKDSGLLPEDLVREPLGLSEEVLKLGHAIIGSTRLRQGLKIIASVLLLSTSALIGYLIFDI
ncbi:MAG: four helix bundle protein [Planctomycetota bacterium]